jgi:hypothetical protein
MAGKDISVKKYAVRLSAGEREHLQALIRKGKSPAKRLLKPRILLKTDVSEAGEGWSDSWIIVQVEMADVGTIVRRPHKPDLCIEICPAEITCPPFACTISQ